MGTRRLALCITSILLALTFTPSAQAAPSISGILGDSQAKVNSVIRMLGDDFSLVKQVFVDGLQTTFLASSNQQMAIRIPLTVQPGDAEVLLLSDDGSIVASHRIEILATETASNTKITIGTFLGYVAVYTKNLAGHKLSIQLGNKSREVSYLDNNFTANLTRIGSDRLVEVKVLVDNQLVQKQMVLVR